MLFVETVFSSIILTDSLFTLWRCANSKAAYFRSIQGKSRSGEGTGPSGALWKGLVGFMGGWRRERWRVRTPLMPGEL